MYNKYLIPYWQDSIHVQDTWEKINNIPNEQLWHEHQKRKEKLIELVKENIRFKREKKENRLFKWMAGNQIFSIIITFTIFFSVLNIALIINFFKLLSNF